MGKYRSTGERIGTTVLFPIKVLVVALAVALLVIAYVPVAIILLFVESESLKDRLLLAFGWPVIILGINELLYVNDRGSEMLSKFIHAIFRS